VAHKTKVISTMLLFDSHPEKPWLKFRTVYRSLPHKSQPSVKLKREKKTKN